MFDSVGLRYEEVSETSAMLFMNFEGKPISMSVLGGYGSYELLRAGWRFSTNSSARAYRPVARLQSFKSTQGDLLYTVPEVFGENMNLFLQGSVCGAEEVSFTAKNTAARWASKNVWVPIKTDFSPAMITSS